MKGLPLLLFALIYGSGLFAQKKTFLTVKAGQNIMDVLSTAEVFYYPQFTSGNVFLRDGTRAAAKLNYNRLVDEMHFIDPKGDTLALADEKTIKYIVISKDTFYYDGGYVRLLSAGQRVKLAVKQVWVIADARQAEAKNSATKSVFADYLTTNRQGGRFYDLMAKEDVVLTKAEHFYFGDNYNRFVLAGKKNLLQLFPKEQSRIETYLKENKISFNNKEDLEKVAQLLEPL